jgi:formylglycine-generating enzyme required for sulfatase activity
MIEGGARCTMRVVGSTKPSGLRLAAAFCTAALAAACGDPRYGEVILVVDTDLPVPRLASRLRVDAFTEDGRWFVSRDIRLPDPLDWPASFSLHAPTDERDTRTVVRLRVYPDGRTRTYRGERFRERPVFVEPFVPHSIEEMCTAPPELVMGSTVTVRRTREPFEWLSHAGDCSLHDTKVGAAAAFVDIAAPGTYRFGVTKVDPTGINPAGTIGSTQVTLQLRRDCGSSATALACATGITLPATVDLPIVDVSLASGRYFVVVAGASSWDGPADITIGSTLVDAWTELDTATDPPEEDPGLPLSLDGAADRTPELEPQPQVTIDRLLVVQTTPGVVRRADVLLRGACVGTMAKLDPRAAGWIDGAASCLDVENQRAPLVEPSTDESITLPDPGVSAVGSFPAAEPCDPADGSPYVCVPGGVFLLGSPEAAGVSANSSVERVAVVSRFWMDRNEVTTARYRRALESGFAPQQRDRPTPGEPCRWTEAPGPYEDFAVGCLSWYGARAFCQFHGGDLPTEAQWEHAASASAREVETNYPWGDEPPRCACQDLATPCHAADVARVGSNQACGDAANPNPPPHPVTFFDAPNGDVGVAGVVGLVGGMQEWTRDSFHAYAGPCWEAASLWNPSCWEVDGTQRALRGGCWAGPIQGAVAWVRKRDPAGLDLNLTTGFRCAYAHEPVWP